MRHLILAVFPLSLIAADPAAINLDAGYRSMYDLDFGGAHQKFASFKQANPEDPMGPISNAAAYLFSELERLHVLDSELFVDDDKFKLRQRLTPSPETKRAFDEELSKGRESARRVRSNTPDDQNALLADVLAHGLEADYLSLIEHRDLAALGVVKEGRALALHLLNTHPDCYDAYLAIGVENYLLSLKPAPVRWILSWGGAQTSKQEGIAKLRLTAEKGNLLQPYAKMLLAVAALRDNDKEHAAQILEGLVREFPHNRLYAAELARVRSAK
ncbi:MAG TPA: hypothetical protein VK752_21000 [Bryobacteraceae bacterium]|nr:hypothetical protein [Bryobacteraceae bacterium]